MSIADGTPCRCGGSNDECVWCGGTGVVEGHLRAHRRAADLALSKPRSFEGDPGLRPMRTAIKRPPAKVGLPPAWTPSAPIPPRPPYEAALAGGDVKRQCPRCGARMLLGKLIGHLWKMHRIDWHPDTVAQLAPKPSAKKRARVDPAKTLQLRSALPQIRVNLPLGDAWARLPSTAAVLCPICEKSQRAVGLPAHIRHRHRVDPYRPQRAQLSRHRTHSFSRPQLRKAGCPLCLARFTLNQLEAHLRTLHRVAPARIGRLLR
jgi:hypothetical protein